MISCPAILLLALLTTVAGSARAQVGDSAAAQQAAAVDSALVARLQKEVDWRQLIRVRTGEIWVQLLDPSVSARGIDYDRLRVIEAPADAALPPRPIPLPAILTIEARQGNPKAGMILGGVVGAGLATTVVYGLTKMEGDGNVAAALGVGILLGGPAGVLFGSFLGEAMYSWEPVYTAAPTQETSPP